MMALWATTQIMPGLTYTGGIISLVLGALGLMVVNLAVVPLLKIMFLPLNLLTLGVFTWAVNVIGLYFLTKVLPKFELISYSYPGGSISGVILPPIELNILVVAIISSFLIGFISHFLQWLVK